ncbi:Calmodulin binding protein-like [Musa troglodytarum]|uniref:Calmodulin binding protein-like n=2 Tax=Musa troglodytarum TaxID=320322 RepID=A0A9E7EAX4_9LILI|nr:Calmodulin binding protein-like [Musa troglodytarum]
MSQKRQPEEGEVGASSDGSGSPDEKRQKIRFHGVVKEAMQMHRIQKCLAAMEPLIRKIIREEVDLALSKHLASIARQCENQVVCSTTRSLQLQFKSKLSLPIFTGSRIEGEDTSALSVALIDALTGQVVTTGPESSLKVEIVVLEGDFEFGEDGNWTFDEFKNNIVREREGKRSLLTGDVFVDLNEGIGTLGELSFTDNSSWTRSRKFRLGARVPDGHCNGIRVREAKTGPFMVKDHRGELYKKHHPPALSDEVWRLEKIGKDGAFHKRLSNENINTVQDFLFLLCKDSTRLRNILGSGMSGRMWEVTVEHARTCILTDQVHVYYPDGQRKTGFIFNDVGEVLGVLSEQQLVSVNDLPDDERATALDHVKQAYEHWNDVTTYEKADVLGISSPALQNSSLGLENMYSNFPSPVKGDGFGFTYSSIPSPDIFSVGGMRGLDAYTLEAIGSMEPRYEQDSQSTSLYDGCSSQALFGSMPQYNSSFSSPSVGFLSESPADFGVAFKGFMDSQLAAAAAVKPRRGWRKLSCVFKFISKIVMSMKSRVHEA